jgi:hypothetical protein
MPWYRPSSYKAPRRKDPKKGARVSKEDLAKLLEAGKKYSMSAEQKEKQRRSFAFGNAKIENEKLTREAVDKAAEKMKSEPHGSDRST